MSLLFCGVVGPCRGEQNVKGKGLSKLFPQLCRREDCLGQAENFKAPLELCCLKLSLVVRVFSTKMQGLEPPFCSAEKLFRRGNGQVFSQRRDSGVSCAYVHLNTRDYIMSLLWICFWQINNTLMYLRCGFGYIWTNLTLVFNSLFTFSVSNKDQWRAVRALFERQRYSKK